MKIGEWVTYRQTSDYRRVIGRVMDVDSGRITLDTRAIAEVSADGTLVQIAATPRWSVEDGAPPPTQLLASVFGMGTNYFS
jgi:hypothetical protein